MFVKKQEQVTTELHGVKKRLARKELIHKHLKPLASITAKGMFKHGQKEVDFEC